MENARARDRTCTFAPAKKTSCTIGVNGLPTASALPAPTERRFRRVPFQRAALNKYTLSIHLCGRAPGKFYRIGVLEMSPAASNTANFDLPIALSH
jgi:hypothetical protein